MAFEVLVHEKARRKLDKLKDESLKQRLKDVFNLLSEPFFLDTIKVQDAEGVYRTRIGKYRILEVIKDKKVYIIDFDHRGKVYKKL